MILKFALWDIFIGIILGGIALFGTHTYAVAQSQISIRTIIGVYGAVAPDQNSDGTINSFDFALIARLNTIPSPSPIVPPPPPGGSSQGIIISTAELAARPISGQSGCASGSICDFGWKAILAKADSNWGSPDLTTYDLAHPPGVLAAAIAGRRLSFESSQQVKSQQYTAKAIAGLMAVIGTELPAVPNSSGGGGKDDGSLSIGRQLPFYVLAADILGIYPDGNATSTGTKWGTYVNYMLHQKFTFRVGDGGATFSNGGRCASNGCAMSLAVRIITAAYLKDKSELDGAWLTFRRYTGDYNALSDFVFSSTGDTWYHNNSQKLAINPKGATCAGSAYPADGAIPNDQGRGGSCPSNSNTVPGYTQYPWEGIQGAFSSAIALNHLGYKDASGKNPFQINDSALLRAAQYQWYLQSKFGGSWYDASRASWVKHMLNVMYGYKPIQYSPGGGAGRNMGYTQWLFP